jgi:hypothetical protein
MATKALANAGLRVHGLTETRYRPMPPTTLHYRYIDFDYFRARMPGSPFITAVLSQF